MQEAPSTTIWRMIYWCRPPDSVRPVPGRRVGTAMQRYSWTNNRQTVFSPRPARAIFNGVLDSNGRRSRRTATSEDGQLAAYAGGGFARPLGQPFPSVRAADAVSVPQR